jgi:hypothetical protein
LKKSSNLGIIWRKSFYYKEELEKKQNERRVEGQIEESKISVECKVLISRIKGNCWKRGGGGALISECLKTRIEVVCLCCCWSCGSKNQSKRCFDAR